MLCLCGCGRVVERRDPRGPAPKWLPSHRPGVRRQREKRKCVPRECEQCGSAFTATQANINRGWGRFCSKTCRTRATFAAKWANPTAPTIRRLRDDEPVPTSEPKRYRHSEGYVILRWLVATQTYVEAFEHRIVTGRVSEDVHHINGDKTDNRQENLMPMSRAEHARLHARMAK
jgi:hypothetical protein